MRQDEPRIDKEAANLLHNSAVNMKIFRILLVAAAAAAALWTAPACDGTSPLFESTNLDPHPPQITGILVEQADLGLGLTGQRVTFSYFDAGEDIEEYQIVPLGIGATQAENIVEPVTVDDSIFAPPTGEEVVPDDIVFFPGETGEVQVKEILGSTLVGRHVMKIFLFQLRRTFNFYYIPAVSC